MAPLINPIYVHAVRENQWYHLRNPRFENQIEVLTEKRFCANSIFAKTAALVGSLSGIGMIVAGVVKSLQKTDASVSNTGTQILPIAGGGILIIAAVWGIYQRAYSNRLRACRLTLNQNLDDLFIKYKGKANFNQIFTKVDCPRKDSKFKFQVDRDGEIGRSSNEEGCCLVQANQN